MKCGSDESKYPIGVEAYRFRDEKERQQQAQHGGVFGQGLPLLGAEEFSTKGADVLVFH